MRQAGYTVMTSSFSSASDVIFVMTPERFLVHLEKQDCYHPDYIFIDEAQTIITGKERSLLYYRIVDRVARLKQDFNIMFSSPNIPNPEVFSKLIPSSSDAQYFSDDCKSALSSKYTPVSHFIFFADLIEKKIDIINRLSSEYVPLVGIKTPNTDTLNFVKRIGKGKNNVVYISSIQKAMEWALSYAADCKIEEIPLENQQKLSEASDFIKEKIHSLCFLAETIKKGVAYHIGYLPSSVRKLIEKLFRAGVIHTIFCTSTIIDGVNFPADNLFITSLKRGSSNLTEVEFRNLMGRSGRMNLLGVLPRGGSL